jgi:hypothetical protein
MDVGMMMVFASYGWDAIGDDQVWDEEIRLARLAADSGFDVLWSAEHHFFDYSFCPDNLQLMAFLAAACPGVGLGTAAVIVPGTIRSALPSRRRSWTCCARESCGSGWDAAWRGANSRRSAGRWTSPASASTKRHR